MSRRCEPRRSGAFTRRVERENLDRLTEREPPILGTSGGQHLTGGNELRVNRTYVSLNQPTSLADR